MTDHNNPHNLEQVVADASHQGEANYYHDEDHTNPLPVSPPPDYTPLPDFIENGEMDVRFDFCGIKTPIKLSLTTDVISAVVGFVTGLLVLVLSVTAAFAIAIIGLSLVSCLSICGRRQKARVYTTMRRASLAGETEEQGREVGLAN
ncbi:hypothetical protein B0I37DRAFT_349993 [Chaetomium sp. MPI-CAGE-AT-0009]|nr:hypothetical protein B0I37DRAFT_349993 [Chaetomium sp. MPI-CAGE-AT-0009]